MDQVEANCCFYTTRNTNPFSLLGKTVNRLEGDRENKLNTCSSLYGDHPNLSDVLRFIPQWLTFVPKPVTRGNVWSSPVSDQKVSDTKSKDDQFLLLTVYIYDPSVLTTCTELSFKYYSLVVEEMKTKFPGFLCAYLMRNYCVVIPLRCQIEFSQSGKISGIFNFQISIKIFRSFILD